MSEVFRTTKHDMPGESTVVVIHCSDPRYQPHFQEFLREGLGLLNYALLAVPGGAQLLTLVDYLPKFSWAGWRWLKFVMELTQAPRIVLIAHDDCRWYLGLPFSAQRQPLRQRLEADRRRVRVALEQRFPRAKVELYYAGLQDGHAVFTGL